MSLHRTVAHGTIIQITGKAVSTLLGFIAIALMTRSLGTEQFGWYVTAASFLQFIGIINDFGFVLTTSNMLSEGAFERGRLLNTIFTWRAISALLFHGLAPFVFLFFPFSWEIKMAVGILSASFFFQALNQVFIGLYREQLRMTIAIMGEVVGRIALVASIAFVAAGQKGFLWLMAAVSIASLFSTLYYWYFSPGIRLQTDRAISKALFSKLWPTAIAVVFNSLYLQAGRVILPLHVSQVEVGLFGAALRVYDIVLQIAALIMGMMMPLVAYAWARKLQPELKERMQLSLNLTTLILIPLITGMIMLGKPFMVLVAGSEFVGSGFMLAVISFALFGACFGMIFGHIALAINRQKSVLWVYMSDALISFVAFWYAIPLYGWLGAAAVMIFSEIYAGLGLTILAIYYARTTPSFLAFFKISLASAGMALLLHYSSAFSLIINVLLGAATYVVLIFTMRVMTWSKFKALLIE